jgi:hypothetical protein
MAIESSNIQRGEPHWRKASMSNGSGACVELALAADGGVLVRDSKDRSGPILRFTHAEWEAFVDGVRKGEFDDLA